MRLFHTEPNFETPEPDGVINLHWQYEVSEDGGKTWYPEVDRDDGETYVLRRGNWVAPSVN